MGVAGWSYHEELRPAIQQTVLDLVGCNVHASVPHFLHAVRVEVGEGDVFHAPGGNLVLQIQCRVHVLR